MSAGTPDDISGPLVARSRGDEAALNDVMPMVYEDLRGIARRQLRQAPAHITSSGTLAHEAYLRLVQARGIRCRNRAHFFALCSQMIRRILVDHARKRRYAKRGGGEYGDGRDVSLRFFDKPLSWRSLPRPGFPRRPRLDSAKIVGLRLA